LTESRIAWLEEKLGAIRVGDLIKVSEARMRREWELDPATVRTITRALDRFREGKPTRTVQEILTFKPDEGDSDDVLSFCDTRRISQADFS
jgi:hypothetical protein